MSWPEPTRSRPGHLDYAVSRLQTLLNHLRVSRYRDTVPVGVSGPQPMFLNAVAELDTALSPRALLDRLLEVERELGRTREGPRYGPRTIDLDLLLYGQETVAEPGLTVPHPRLHERRFVLEPLSELDPALSVPGRGLLADLIAKLESTP